MISFKIGIGRTHMPSYFEIRWHGRGGQGTVTGAKTLAEAVQGTGKYVTAFPEYGPERRGAPVRAFNRFADDKVRTHTPVQVPDLVIVVDPTLIGNPQLIEGVQDRVTFIVNTEKTAEETRKALGLAGNRVFTVPANKISRELFGKEIPNSALLGAFARAYPEIVSLERLVAETRHVFVSLLGKSLAEKNIEAVQRGFEEGDRA
jgi:pyruvate ferredoxin oxidoreductase gamma subunit